MTTLPLSGYRVLELAHLIAGPACGMYLADMGADVVKIEHPTGGDASRTAYGTQLRGESAVFVTVNRNKRSVALDLARPEGLAAFDRLVPRADVVLEACAPVNRYADLPRDPQIAASRLLVEQEHPRAGRFRTLDTPIRFDRTPGGIRTPAPGLGEHTDAVLTEAGLRPADLADLRKSGAIR